jgi:glyoxylase-like metal-dependent hydrolase (beta-lactamase superfamily II)
MRLRTLAVGALRCNCFIVGCDETGEAAIVDPGDDADEILEAVREMDVTVKLLLHTHGHFDHIMATDEVAAMTRADILLHREDGQLYENLPAQGRVFGIRAGHPPAVTRWLVDGEAIAIGKLSVRVIHTPGHTPGSVGFYFAAPSPLLLGGDTLFANGVGRTDLPGGSWEALESSIRERLYVLPEETRVIPGHGAETTIAWERAHNPYVRA